MPLIKKKICDGCSKDITDVKGVIIKSPYPAISLEYGGVTVETRSIWDGELFACSVKCYMDGVDKSVREWIENTIEKLEKKYTGDS